MHCSHFWCCSAAEADGIQLLLICSYSYRAACNRARSFHWKRGEGIFFFLPRWWAWKGEGRERVFFLVFFFFFFVCVCVKAFLGGGGKWIIKSRKPCNSVSSITKTKSRALMIAEKGRATLSTPNTSNNINSWQGLCLLHIDSASKQVPGIAESIQDSLP